MFTLSFSALLMFALNSLGVFTQIPTDSIDYWIGNISPRCAINIIYLNFRNDFTFNSAHNIPVMLVPIEYHFKIERFNNHLINQKFRGSSLRFMKAECYFSILYDNQNTFYQLLYALLFNMAYGVPNYSIFDSNWTYCLALYRGNEIDDVVFNSLLGFQMAINLALVIFTSKIRYNVYCKTSEKFEFATSNIGNEEFSIVDPKFTSACLSQHKLVCVNEHSFLGVYHPEQLAYEHKIVTYILSKANVTMDSRDRYYEACPRMVVLDYEQQILPISKSVMPTFDYSVRFFTCYTIPVLSFNLYVSAFEIQVWIALVLSGILIAIFLQCHIYYNLSKTLNFSTLLFYFSIFTEESYSIPSNVGKNKVYRMATILWLLTAVVYTNTYISHVISELNAPLAGEKIENKDVFENSRLEPEKYYQYFREHHNLLYGLKRRLSKFFDGDVDSFLEKFHYNRTFTGGYRILSEPARLPYPEHIWQKLRNPFIFSIFYDSLHLTMHCSPSGFQRNFLFCRPFMGLMKPLNKFYPDAHTYKRPWNYSNYPLGAVEEELINCQKSVYVEQSDQLEFQYMSENYPKKRFYYLQDTFALTEKKWSFHNLEKSKIPFYFSMFLQSGIFHELHKLKVSRYHLKRRSMTSEIIKRTQKVEVFDMTSSVQTVFILFAAMSLIAKLAFVVEFCYSASNKHNILLFMKELAKVPLGAIVFYHTLNKIVTSLPMILWTRSRSPSHTVSHTDTISVKRKREFLIFPKKCLRTR